MLGKILNRTLPKYWGEKIPRNICPEEKRKQKGGRWAGRKKKKWVTALTVKL